MTVELDAPPLLPLVREALDSTGRLAISYYSASTDRVSERVILPRRLFAFRGHWYVDAWCESAGDLRRFRVDRIASAVPADPDRATSAAGAARNPGAPSLQGRVARTPTGSSRSSPVPTLDGCVCRSSRPVHG